MHRTNIVLDDSLVSQAQKLTGLKTMKEVVHHALSELVRHRHQRNLLKIKGNIKWSGNLSDMRMRRSMQ